MAEDGILYQSVEYAAVAMEVFAVLVIVGGLIYGAGRFGGMLLRRDRAHEGYHDFKAFMGRTLLLGLEILVAADVVSTVALHPSLESVAVLGLLVLIRTFLSWALVVEIEGRWPWQEKPQREPGELD